MAVKKIVFISDYVCPYCLVAKQALEEAVRETGIETEIRYLPFELTEEPKERVDTYHDEVRKSHYRILEEPCHRMGLDMKLPPNVVPRPYTRLAFEGWLYACDHQKGDLYNRLVYLAYFTKEQDIGEIDVLCGIAQEAGLDPGDFRRALQNGIYTKKEKEAVHSVRETYQVKHVPTIYIDGTEVQIKEYTKEEMIKLLHSRDDSEGEGFCCSEDGCGF